MAKRSFLVPVAAAIAALAGNSEAAADLTPANSVNQNGTEAKITNTVVQPNPQKEGEPLLSTGGDIFKYVLKRAESGAIFAQHESHASHASHASHRSHYSSSQ